MTNNNNNNSNNDSHHHYGFWWKDLMGSELKNLSVNKLTVVSWMLKFCLPKVKWPVLIWLSALEGSSKVRTAFLSCQSGSHMVCMPSLPAAGFLGACLGSAVLSWFPPLHTLCVSCCMLWMPGSCCEWHHCVIVHKSLIEPHVPANDTRIPAQVVCKSMVTVRSKLKFLSWWKK